MKIKHPLPQFENKTALFLVSGRHAADLYMAGDGVIEKLDAFRVPKPRYSDREGYFRSSSHGRVLGSGSVYEPKKEEERVEFQQALRKHVTQQLKANDVDEVYLFAPQHELSIVEETMPTTLRKKIVLRIAGNHTKKQPFDLLKRVQKEFDTQERRAPKDKEARQILEKSREARRVIKDTRARK